MASKIETPTASPHDLYPFGVVHGRFQVLHNDHLRYLLAGKTLCGHLVVGITNPDPFLTREEGADPQRSLPEANPLTYYERYVMVREALEEAGLPLRDFAIVPFPVCVPELLRHYVPKKAVFFLTIYDEWGRAKRRLFESLGLQTRVLWEVPETEKGIRGTEVRRRIRDRAPWEHLVPPAVVRLLRAWQIPERLAREFPGTRTDP